jgi:hypothetical protein
LIEKEAIFPIFSEQPLIFLQKYSDFDSAIPGFAPSAAPREARAGASNPA